MCKLTKSVVQKRLNSLYQEKREAHEKKQTEIEYIRLHFGAIFDPYVPLDDVPAGWRLLWSSSFSAARKIMGTRKISYREKREAHEKKQTEIEYIRLHFGAIFDPYEIKPYCEAPPFLTLL